MSVLLLDLCRDQPCRSVRRMSLTHVKRPSLRLADRTHPWHCWDMTYDFLIIGGGRIDLPG